MAKEKRKFKKERPPDPNSTNVDWRLFIAVTLPPEAIAVVDRLVTELSSADWPVRWVAPETAHLTLHFLGDVPPERAQLLRMSLAQPIGKQRSFTIRTGSLGVFPDLERPRVIWVGLDGQTDHLTALNSAITTTLRSLELPVEDRPYRAHLTLGRVRDNPPPNFAAGLQRRLSEPDLRALVTELSVTFPVTSVQLMRSYLDKSGVRHETLANYPLLAVENREH